MNQASLLAKAALTFGDRPAVSLGGDVVLSYAALADRVARMARGLRLSQGLAAGDRVALVMKNVPAYLECLYAIWHAGLVAVPINAKLHAREFAYILENSGAKLCFVSPELAGDLPADQRQVAVGGADHTALLRFDPMPVAETAPDDLAWLFYTSGTTGMPKGAMLSQRNLMAMVMNYFADVDQVSEQDSMIHCAPMSHGSGLYGLPHVAKAANNVYPASGGFEPAECLNLIARWPNATFFFAPTMITRLLAAPELADAGTGNLKTIVYGGGPMYVEDTLKALEALGPKLVQIYGQGESPMTITGLSRAMHEDRDHPRYMARLGSVGVARTDLDVRVVDEDDNDLPVGEAGEILCRGDVVMAGYFENPEATAAALRGGWLHTGDVGAFDDDGFLTLMDRAKDMIISGGSNIYPREIEEVLLRHPAVLECAAVGRPHPDWGEEVVAFVVRRDGRTVSEDELDQLCLDNIARFKRPKEYRFVESLTKNNYGKVLKTELREILGNS